MILGTSRPLAAIAALVLILGPPTRAEPPAPVQPAAEPETAPADAPSAPDPPVPPPQETGTPAADAPAPPGGTAPAAEAPAPAPEAVPGPDAPPVTVQAIWIEKEIDFTYMGFTSFYSCAGLRDKLRWIVQQIGAAEGSTVSMRGCLYTNSVERIPRAVIRLAIPREATPELLAELEKDASKRELIARARAERPVVGNPEAQFPARVKRVTFSDSPVGRIDAGDCELIDQLHDQVFLPLGLRIVSDRINCVPRRVSAGSVNLELEVLVPSTPEPAPAEQADPGAAP